MLDRHFRVDFGLRTAIHQTLVMLTEFYDPGLEPTTGWGRWSADSIYAIGAYPGLYALWLVLRPVLVRPPATAEERSRAAAVVRAHGRTALARMELLEDKRYWFSPGGTVFAYVVKGRVALALGDPIGPPQDAAGAI